MSIQSYRSLEIGITDLIILFGPGPNKKIGPDRIVTETVKGPFSWTDGLGPVRSTEDREDWPFDLLHVLLTLPMGNRSRGGTVPLTSRPSVSLIKGLARHWTVENRNQAGL